MPQGNPKTGELYTHVKGGLYQIVTSAEHADTGETLVIYQALYPPFQTYARPEAQFTSQIDPGSYPKTEQRYLFQLTAPTADGNGRVPEVGLDPQAGHPGAEKDRLAPLPKKLSAEEKLMAFFDADSMEEKYQILLGMEDDVTDRMINNMAVVLDVVINEGPLEQRYEELKRCIRTFQKYENTRLR